MLRRWTALTLLVALTACAGEGAREAPNTAEDHAAEASAADDHGHDHSGAAAAGGEPTKNFPDMAYLEQIPVAYAAAKANPEVFEKIPCYCPCMLYGHGGLIDCYRSQHAPACATCLEEGIMAHQIIEERGAADPAAIALEVKNRYRGALVRSTIQRGEMPNLRSQQGMAYLQACSECHQPAHPGMYSGDDWRRSLARMETYVQQQGLEIEPATWEQAVEYVRSTAGGFPASAGEQYRRSLAEAVDHLKVAEGDSVYYPTVQDQLLDEDWFERMVEAYRVARDIPADVLAATLVDDPSPNCNNLLDCLNSTAAVVSEAAVEAIEKLAAERANDD